MRQLHVVAVSEDGRNVVLATSKGATRGDFRVALDDRLAAAVRGDLPRPGESAPAVVTPKEIQARLRAGESPEQIAASAGVPVAKIERYAGPVLSERERVLNQARAGFVSRSRLGQSALPLGEAVDLHLSTTTGVRPETVEWSTRREESGTWLVELTYVSQARRRTAAWRYDVARREVTPTDNNSAVLAHVEPGRRSKSHAEPVVPAPAASRGGRGRRAPVREAAAPVRTVAARPATGTTVAAAQVAPARAAAGQAGAAARPASGRATGRAAAKAARATTAARAGAAAARDTQARDTQARARAAEAARVQAQREAVRAAEAERQAAAAAEAKRQAAAAEKAERARAAKQAKAAKAAQAKAAREAAEEAARAAAEQAAREAAEQAAAVAAQAAEQAAREAAQAAERAAREAAERAAREADEQPPAPPTLRVVGADDDASAAPRRARKAPPAAARTAPRRAAGQRAAVPGWADVLLSSTPLARSAEPDEDTD